MIIWILKFQFPLWAKTYLFQDGDESFSPSLSLSFFSPSLSLSFSLSKVSFHPVPLKKYALTQNRRNP